MDTCIPGDLITINGIVKAVRSEGSVNDKNKNLFLLYIDAKSVGGGRVKGEKTQISEFTADDYRMIQHIAVF